MSTQPPASVQACASPRSNDDCIVRPMSEGGTSSQIEINKRERLQCEWDIRHGKPVVRILRLKPTADGTMRAAGPQIEFADRHLPGVIAMLQDLQGSQGG